MASLKLNTSTHTTGLRITNAMVTKRPISPPKKAPLVVRFFQNMDKNIIGKLVLAAIAKASPTIKAIFCFSNMMPRKIAKIPRKIVAILETNNSFFSFLFEELITLA